MERNYQTYSRYDDGACYSRNSGGDDDWLALGALLVIGIVVLLVKIIATEKERARVNELDRKHQQMRADIQSGRWRNQ